MALKLWIAFNQDLFDQELRERSQNGELTDLPAFTVEISGQGIVEVTALVIEAVIVGYAERLASSGRVIFVTNNQPAYPPHA